MSNDIEIIAPINENLKTIIPPKDRILCSTIADAIVYITRLGSNKTTMISWKTPLLITDNGVAFLGGQNIGLKPINYIPMGFILWVKPRSGRNLRILPEAGTFKDIINLYPLINKGMDRKNWFTYIDKLKPIWEQRVREMEESIIRNLDSIDKLPKFREYIRNFENVPKSVYKRAIKEIKKKKK